MAFLNRIDKEAPGGCWVWTGHKNAKGYGQIGQFKAHRYSYEKYVGPIPDGICVLHKCDNPPCVNPDHLFLGTHKDNTADMIRKNRNKHVRGENNYNSKLTENNIDDIYHMKSRGGTNRSIAITLGVTQSTITRILNGKKWRHHARHTQ